MSSFKQNISFVQLIILVFIILIVSTSCMHEITPHSPGIDRGILDLSDYDLDRDEIIKLDGQWEFYWEKFITYGNIEEVRPDLYVDVPQIWNRYLLNGNSLPGQGYATYIIHVETSLPEDTLLGLRLHTFSSAYQLYINEKMIASNGKVGTSAEDEVGEYRPQVAIFNTPAKEFDIIVHVSNFEDASGGFWCNLYLGEADHIQDYHDSLMIKEAMIIGALLIIAWLFLSIHLIRKELKYTLYFSLFCFSLAIAIDIATQNILMKIIGNISFNSVIFFWYSSSSWALFFLFKYIHELFPSEFSRKAGKILLGYVCVVQILFAVTKPTLYTKLGPLINFVESSVTVCIIIIILISLKRKNHDIHINLISVVILLLVHAHDLLYWNNVINPCYGEIGYIGMFIFLFLQMFLQANRIGRYYEEKMTAELDFIQSQIKPHFLFNAINTIIAISRFDPEIARELLETFSRYLRGNFVFKGAEQYVSLKSEIELVMAYVDIEKARFEGKLEVVLNNQVEMETKVPRLILQPIVENAIIHGVLPKPEGGRVVIDIIQKSNAICFSVTDNGVGIDFDKLNKTQTNDNQSGIGLSNVENRLKTLFQQDLEISSNSEGGIKVSWKIPINILRRKQE